MPELADIWAAVTAGAEVATGPTFTALLNARNDEVADVIRSRLTPEVERHLVFMLDTAAPENIRRYQTWFVQRYVVM